jgi:hypothetical protein
VTISPLPPRVTNDTLYRFQDEMRDYADQLRIDKYKLDSEIAKQGDLYYRVSQRAAESTSYRDACKHRLAVVEADAAQYYRTRNMENREKTTEVGIKEAVTLDKLVNTAQADLIAWERCAREWQAMQGAVDQRNRMLQSMASLYASGYFTLTSAGRASDDVKEARASAGRQMLAQRRELPDRPRLTGRE